ncbi:hypothetical protein [Pseudomonas koreensis]|uniref:Uncharacterized protein n=1 Tax=Pseudomonas koreensis TaxID=198620 RepID=A0A9X2XE81_9PSED|nr:hypothetical protein [Pseudomonas koreensis]MCU7247281.1 hypothetical protein [Pseudomonas koreensis]
MILNIPTLLSLRTRMARWTTPLLFSVTLCSLALHQVNLSWLTQRVDKHSELTDLHHLEDRVMALEKAQASIEPAQSGVSYSDLNQLNDSFNERITELASAMSAVASQAGLDALLQRVQQLETTRLQRAIPVPAATIRNTPRKAKTSVQAPIQVLGHEVRGGEEFLSVGPQDAQSLNQCQLLRVGESYAGWKLEAIEEQVAVFTAHGTTHRLSIR